MSSQNLPRGSHGHDDPVADSTTGDSLSFDTSVAHPARIYNYWLGGKDNYEADRQAAEQAIAVTPGHPPWRAPTGPSCGARSSSWPVRASGSSSTSAPGCPRPITPTRSLRTSPPCRLEDQSADESHPADSRPRAQIAAYFDGLDLVEPGLVGMPEWRGEANPHVVINAFAGVAREP
jgi:hypothetical protein